MVNEIISSRDAFFNKLYELAKQDRNIILVSADMGAPSLDKFRKDLKEQYVDVGIAEQNALLIAAGLALSGKKTYVYAIMPFVTTRIHEFIKLEMGLMKLPITIIGVGSGYSYEDSGPTHHTVEDISIIRPIPNVELFNISDSQMAEKIAEYTSKSKNPSYIRLDRHVLKLKYSQNQNFSEGFIQLKKGKDTCIITTGNMVDEALDIVESYSKLGKEIGLIDVFQIKPLNPKIKEILLNYKNLISIEEHLLEGGFGSIFSELITDNNLPLKLKRIGADNRYNYEYGGREYIREKMGIGKDKIKSVIDSM